MIDFLDDLRQRGLIQDSTEAIGELFAKGPVTAYIGFDPTSVSLGIGNLVTVSLLQRFQQAGHKAIVLLGGATGLIGDPSGKDQERQLLTKETIEHNIACQREQMARFIQFDGENPALLVNNHDFYKDMSVFDFLRDVGKQVTVNYMMSKESVKNRLETGISFTEFSYQLIQGYDFLYLNREYGCSLQMGGADQWGNITTGLEFLRKNQRKGHGLTCPLLTKSDGKKFGKSESGNIFLAPELTSPYKFYQFWLNVADADLPKLLRCFSFRTMPELLALEAEHAENPNALKALLAEEMTVKVHGQEAFESASEVSSILFSRKMAPEFLEKLAEERWQSLGQEIPRFALKQLPQEGLALTEALAVEAQLFQSKADVRRAVKNNALAINTEKVKDSEQLLKKEDFFFGKYLFVENGKKNKFVLCLEN